MIYCRHRVVSCIAIQYDQYSFDSLYSAVVGKTHIWQQLLLGRYCEFNLRYFITDSSKKVIYKVFSILYTNITITFSVLTNVAALRSKGKKRTKQNKNENTKEKRIKERSICLQTGRRKFC